MARSGVRRLAIGLAQLAAAAVLAACHDSVGPAACLEPGGSGYEFAIYGDPALVFHWPAAYNPVRVYAEPTGDLRQNVQAALELWESAFRCGELALVMTADSTRADVIVRNPAASPVRSGAGRVVLRADSVGACGGVTVFDTTAGHLAEPMRAYVYPESLDTAAVRACYHFTTAHELGHTLGLGAHSPDTNDLMNALPRRPALSDRDRYTIQLLYHSTPTIGPPPR